MRTVITAEGFDLSDALRESVRREIGRFVQSAPRPVNIISVHLVDNHGRALSGQGKLCRVSVQYEDERCSVACDAEADFDASVAEAFLKAMRPS
jgi:hypothetical protein